MSHAARTTLTDDPVIDRHLGPAMNGAPAIRPVGREEVMAAVLEAATELFAERGPDAVTVREVADRAGVNHALIHRHYGTKDELLRVVLSQAIDRMAAVSEGITNTHEDVVPLVAELRAIEPAVRLVAWALLSGYAVDELWPEYPAITKLKSVLADERAAAGSTERDREDPSVAIVTSAAMVLGWMVFRPLLDRGGRLDQIEGFDEATMLNDGVQHLLGRAR